MTDVYQTIESPSTGEYKDRGSKFLAYAYPVFKEQEWKAHLEQLQKDHLKARHHCYAYRLGLNGSYFRANDDGEPSGTAGKPILGQIDKIGLTNLIVIVVRYFGGTKLGTSGLINAYKQSTAMALEQATIIQKTVEEIYQITFHYGLMNPVMRTIKQLDLTIVEQDFGDTAQISIAIPQSLTASKIHQIKAGVAGVRLEEINEKAKISGLDIVHLLTR